MFDKLKSLFIVDDEQFKKKVAAEKGFSQDPPSTTDKKPAAVNTPTPSPVSPAKATDGQIRDKFINILFGAMEKNNLDGFDYLEFKQTLRNLAKMSMDEPTRFQSAFASAQTMGATPEKLINAAQHYLNVLGQEEHKFQQALNNQRSKQIGDKENNIKQLAQQIQQKQKQIEQLQKEIESDKAAMSKMENEVSGATVKVEQTKNDFVASYQALVNQIKTDIENMKKYLK